MILKQDWIILSVFYRYPQECLINKEPEDKLAFLSVWSCLYGRKISHKKHPVNVSLVSNIYGAVQLAYLRVRLQYIHGMILSHLIYLVIMTEFRL